MLDGQKTETPAYEIRKRMRKSSLILLSLYRYLSRSLLDFCIYIHRRAGNQDNLVDPIVETSDHKVCLELCGFSLQVCMNWQQVGEMNRERE